MVPPAEAPGCSAIVNAGLDARMVPNPELDPRVTGNCSDIALIASCSRGAERSPTVGLTLWGQHPSGRPRSVSDEARGAQPSPPDCRCSSNIDVAQSPQANGTGQQSTPRRAAKEGPVRCRRDPDGAGLISPMRYVFRRAEGAESCHVLDALQWEGCIQCIVTSFPRSVGSPSHYGSLPVTNLG